ncbi:monocarboxylate transporter 10 isoform X2 [Phlebotomus papatasi]|uniref:monocarboxylate transporter 10 isoform X2 n=1 Tax=Phlebotomus papatasi TaxID=29031 RepID=UPI002483FA31|nr:monocarboxylate transporter 10 isoform X2 [Phlebotomus papatasi]XP_055701752.1 monocarboxylate transporter 10 isoform X2 [Phlebotomus papatasi]XP_055701759.1 monocarboxylate transporter 10 isoform X2 [Phlebotomus papatasi]XP_055701766.1 monocarboxylate transporter 10 isoform X2 [Phlebotomus papatasi]XP_055701774.1 monocarboxylate transporter 10 isoform X2 [Phlebotomus papatasi]
MTKGELLQENGAAFGNGEVRLSNGSLGNDRYNKQPKVVPAGACGPKERPASLEMKEPPDGGTRAWLIVISSFFCNGIIFGVINTYSVIYVRLQEELKARGDPEASSKSALVGSLTIGATFLLSPVAGILTDKIGLRRTAILGGILTSCGLLLSSFVTKNINALYLTYGIMYGFGAALTYTPSLSILGHYFKRYLGKVNGFVTAGSSVFTAIMPFLINWLISSYGLSAALRVEAGISSLIILCALLYTPISPKVSQPQRVRTEQSPVRRTMQSLVNVDNWKKKRYVIWALSIPVALFGYFVPYVHMSKFITVAFSGNDINLPVMCLGISSGVGRLVFGFIADLPRINRILLQQVSFCFIGIMTMFLPMTSSYILLLAFVLAMGLFDGCFISLIGPISFDICGPKGASQAIGFLLGLCSFPLTLGPPIAGMLYDHTGSYTLPFILAGIPPLVGATTMLLIRCVKDESVGTEMHDKDPVQYPLAKTAWDEERPFEDRTFCNGRVPHTLERKASLASAESLNDVTNT